uniref:Uncharacterized protein n=1 Tax=Cucumis melo TaxID=3656 RepID=A0A9I9E2W8_CUCME
MKLVMELALTLWRVAKVYLLLLVPEIPTFVVVLFSCIGKGFWDEA